MSKKFSNKVLIGVLAALVAVYALVEFSGNKKRSSSLRSTLVDIDTTKITKINVFSKSDTVGLFKEGEDWKVRLSTDKVVSASEDLVGNAIGALMSVSPSRMASKSKDKWKDYQVDSTGTRVQIFEGSNKTLDIILGRFAMEGQKSYHTFVRLEEDNEIYAANNFMGFSVSSDASAYRDNVIARIKRDSLTSVTLNYPADSSVVLVNNAGRWSTNGVDADSASVVDYLSKLSYLNSREFVNDVEGLTLPAISATFSFNNAEDIVIEGFQRAEGWIIHSNVNEEGYFKDQTLFDKVFKGPDTFAAK